MMDATGKEAYKGTQPAVWNGRPRGRGRHCDEGSKALSSNNIPNLLSWLVLMLF